jgi:biopolymer transport protein TolQ
MTTPMLLADASQAPATAGANLNPIDLVLHATGPVFVVFWLLVAMAAAVWVIGILKALQLSRMRAGLHAFEREAFSLLDAKDLFELARRQSGSPGARVVLAIARRAGSQKILESIAKRAIVDEQQRAGRLMTLLASIASSAPFIGLFGTVWGILDAFLRIGREKSASLPVVAPAIGEALIATAVGLFAAIPALILYNLLSRRLEDFVSELEAAAEAWITTVAETDQAHSFPADRTVPQGRPPAGYADPHDHAGGYRGYPGG